jgi:hypothetical protein
MAAAWDSQNALWAEGGLCDSCYYAWQAKVRGKNFKFFSPLSLGTEKEKNVLENVLSRPILFEDKSLLSAECFFYEDCPATCS